jgi:hypothetical protein
MAIEVEQSAVEVGEAHRGQRTIEGTYGHREYRIL